MTNELLLLAIPQEGLDWINQYIIEISNYLGTFAGSHLTMFSSTARVLCCIFAMLIAGGMAYKMMANGERLDILKLGRPILIGLIIANWPVVCSVLLAPGSSIESYFRDKFETERVQVEDLRQQRKEKAEELTEWILTKKAAADEAERTKNREGEDGGWDQFWSVLSLDYAWDMITDITQKISMSVETWLRHWIEQIVEWLAELFWQCYIYYIFLLKAVCIGVLEIFGPIAFACSVLPVWENEWSKWIGRIVSVSLYGAIAYLVMIFVFQLQKFGLQSDMDMLTYMMNDPETTWWSYMTSGFANIGLFVVTMITGGMVLRMVPELASWVFPADMMHGAGEATRGMMQAGLAGRAAGKIAKTIK